MAPMQRMRQLPPEFHHMVDLTTVPRETSAGEIDPLVISPIQTQLQPLLDIMHRAPPIFPLPCLEPTHPGAPDQ
jgi:hypothetical protein